MKKLTAQEFEMAFSEHEKDCRKCRTKICNYNSKNFNCLQEKDLAVYQELKEYRKAEEEGRIIMLPCKVGDTVYKVWYKPCRHGEDHPDSYSCCGCEDDCDLEKAIFEFVVPSFEWVLDHLRTFGESVWFLTREEAEAALGKG